VGGVCVLRRSVGQHACCSVCTEHALLCNIGGGRCEAYDDLLRRAGRRIVLYSAGPLLWGCVLCTRIRVEHQ
jgi:hypothetical protein